MVKKLYLLLAVSLGITANNISDLRWSVIQEAAAYMENDIIVEIVRKSASDKDFLTNLDAIPQAVVVEHILANIKRFTKSIDKNLPRNFDGKILPDFLKSLAEKMSTHPIVTQAKIDDNASDISYEEGRTLNAFCHEHLREQWQKLSFEQKRQGIAEFWMAEYGKDSKEMSYYEFLSGFPVIIDFFDKNLNKDDLKKPYIMDTSILEARAVKLCQLLLLNIIFDKEISYELLCGVIESFHVSLYYSAFDELKIKLAENK